MTPPQKPVISTRMRFSSVVSILLVTCAFAGCASAAIVTPGRDAGFADERTSADAEQVYRFYIGLQWSVDHA